jgi:hypothetical protein
MLIPFEQVGVRDVECGLEAYAALEQRCSSYAPTKGVSWPPAGLMPLMMALHNLIAVTDPELNRSFSRAGRQKAADWAGHFISQVEMARTRAEVLSRHVVMNHALKLQRRDVYASSFGATSRYLGRPEATGFWTRPRFARRREESRPLPDLWSQMDSELKIDSLYMSLLRLSPMTRLLRAEQDVEPSLGVADLAVLSDDLLRNSIAQGIVDQGLASGVFWGEAIKRLEAAKAPGSLMYYAVALCVEVASIGFLSGVWAADRTNHSLFPFVAFLASALKPPKHLSFFRAYADSDHATLRQCVHQWCLSARDDSGVKEMLDWASYLLKQCGHPRLEHEQSVQPG